MTDQLPDLKVTFQTVYIGDIFGVNKVGMCSHCGSLVPEAPDPLPPNTRSPQQAHADFHSAIVTLLAADPETRRLLAQQIRERSQDD